MSAKLYKQFQDFHNTIKLDKETSQLKEKRETLQTDIENKLPQKLEGIGIEIDTCYSCGGIFLDNGEYDAIRQGIKTKDINDVKSQNNINNINQNNTNGISDDFVRELYREGQAENRRLETMQGIASILNSRRRYGRRFDLFDLMWMIFR